MSLVSRTPVVAQIKSPASCVKCDIDLLPFPHDDNFSEIEILNAFCALDESCSINVEFTELGNEMLFKILSHAPVTSIKILSEHSELSINHILSELESPVNDGIPLDEIRVSISKVEGYNIMKKKILNALEEAIKKQ